MADLEDKQDADAVSEAPPRPHDSIVGQLRIRFEELVNFCRDIDGEIDGDLGDLLTFVRSKLK